MEMKRGRLDEEIEDTGYKRFHLCTDLRSGGDDLPGHRTGVLQQSCQFYTKFSLYWSFYALGRVGAASCHAGAGAPADDGDYAADDFLDCGSNGEIHAGYGSDTDSLPLVSVLLSDAVYSFFIPSGCHLSWKAGNLPASPLDGLALYSCGAAGASGFNQ